jgi:hypothetical protein
MCFFFKVEGEFPSEKFHNYAVGELSFFLSFMSHFAIKHNEAKRKEKSNLYIFVSFFFN